MLPLATSQPQSRSTGPVLRSEVQSSFPNPTPRACAAFPAHGPAVPTSLWEGTLRPILPPQRLLTGSHRVMALEPTAWWVMSPESQRERPNKAAI